LNIDSALNEKHRQRILIVDDERVSRTVLAAALKDDNLIFLARSGAEALEQLSLDPKFDLILLDVMMPKMDGYEVLRRIKNNEATHDIPVIFITALSSVGDEEQGLKLGACDYIAKPFSLAIVKARVANQLRYMHQRKLLETLAGCDGLTEIANRRAFDRTLAREIARSGRNGHPLSLALLDIDCFKQYNDCYGHAQGDETLKAVARALTASLRRPADLVARYGGEEFAIVLPEVDRHGGSEVAEAIRRAIEKLAIRHEDSPVAPHLTVSIGGITCIGSSDEAARMIAAADRQLYEAKRLGRNRIQWGP
jgi:diguanylate cyclase (GGDEF)-like protein